MCLTGTSNQNEQMSARATSYGGQANVPQKHPTSHLGLCAPSSGLIGAAPCVSHSQMTRVKDRVRRRPRGPAHDSGSSGTSTVLVPRFGTPRLGARALRCALSTSPVGQRAARVR